MQNVDMMLLGPRLELDIYVATFYLTRMGQSLNVMPGRPRRLLFFSFFSAVFFLA